MFVRLGIILPSSENILFSQSSAKPRGKFKISQQFKVCGQSHKSKIELKILITEEIEQKPKPFKLLYSDDYRNFMPEIISLIDALEGLKVFVFDFEGTIVSRETYREVAYQYVMTYSLRDRRNALNMKKWWAALRFSKIFDECNSEEQVRTMVYLCKNANVERVYQFGEVFKGRIKPDIRRILSTYPDVERAIVSLDDFRGIKPTMKEIGASKAITNLMVSENGRLNGEVESYAEGVPQWKRKEPMLNGRDKLQAFEAVLKSFGVEFGDAAYFGDDSADLYIMDSLNERGGISVGVKDSKAQEKAAFLIE
jgi:phosphoserine phosphatase